MKIGIIGAENVHAEAFARAINIEKKFSGFSVDYIWGETLALARKVAQAGQIPNIVNNHREMLGNIDAVVVNHRHPQYHLKAALPFVKKGIPVFVDKQLCYRAREGKDFLKIARKLGTPVTCCSSIPKQPSFKRFQKKLPTIGNVLVGSVYGLCSLKNKWGGIYFYGIHQVDMALKAFGYGINQVLITKNSNGATGQLIYSNRKIVTINLIGKGCDEFYITAIGENGNIHNHITIGGLVELQLPVVKTFTTMFRTGKEPEERKYILRPIQVLQALEKSVRSGEVEKVER